jgi:hypothetical protein
VVGTPGHVGVFLKIAAAFGQHPVLLTADPGLVTIISSELLVLPQVP